MAVLTIRHHCHRHLPARQLHARAPCHGAVQHLCDLVAYALGDVHGVTHGNHLCSVGAPRRALQL
eukprot:6520923-Pyramimonas_sp.AAC.1